MPIGTDSVNLFGIWNKTRLGAEGGRDKTRMARDLACNPTAMAVKTGPESVLKRMNRLRVVEQKEAGGFMQPIAEMRILGFHIG